MKIAIPLFHQLTALDCIGPYEVLQRLPGATVTFIAEKTGEVRTDNGFLGLTADATYDDMTDPDVVIIPGGVGTRAVVAEEGNALVEWVKAVHPNTMFTTSVCTGSTVLAKAGLLQDKTATTHWGAFDDLKKLGAIPTQDRVVEHIEDRIITAAGVSSGIDMALRLAELLVDDVAAKAMQLMVEYDPQPPFDFGSVDKANEEVMTRLIEYSANVN